MKRRIINALKLAAYAIKALLVLLGEKLHICKCKCQSDKQDKES